MRRVALAALALVACTHEDDGARYLSEGAFRRATLVASLVNPDNGYSQTRLSHYAVDGDASWDALPEWNPPSAALSLDDTALGEHAFVRYPVQAVAADFDDGVGAIVDVEYADGSFARALTCASCHSRIVDGARVIGLANETIDLGWGHGRIDVAPPPGSEPIAIPDLRPIAYQSHLHRAGGVRNSLAALAVRIETLAITSRGAALRPPRAIPLALARYLQTLAPPPRDATVDARQPGRAVFDRECGACHSGPGLAGPIYSVAAVETDPRVAESSDRGTGGYRAPSLLGLSTRGRLLHDASVADTAALLDPQRQTGGHRFGGASLDANARAELLLYLSSL